MYVGTTRKKKPIFGNRHYDYFAEYFGVNFARKDGLIDDTRWMESMMDEMVKIFVKDNDKFDVKRFRKKVLCIFVECNIDDAVFKKRWENV